MRLTEENESSTQIHIDDLKSDYKLFEATSDEVEILEDKLDKFNLEQLSFVGDMEIKKNYLIKNKTEIFSQESGVVFI